MNARVTIPPDALRDFCRKWQITEFALFDAVVREDFGSVSGVDVMVSFAEGAGHGLFDLEDMEAELKAIVGRDVNIVTRRAVERSRNPIRRRAILDSAEIIYAA